jgi:hypothetical protein
MEDEGKVNLSVRMKKKALQGALEAAAKKKKVRPRLNSPRPWLWQTALTCAGRVCLCRGTFQ